MVAPLVATAVGSGTIPYSRGILPSSQRGYESTGQGERIGLQVIVANPEDLVSVDAFASSGIVVGTTPTKIWGAGSNPLPRARLLRIANCTDSSTLNISHTPSKVISEGWQLTNGASAVRAVVDLPILNNVEVWAAASASTVSIRMLIF